MDDEPTPRPSWLDEPCPSWCVAAHEEQEHPDDRRHLSTATPVPAVVDVHHLDLRPASTDLVVRAVRKVGHDTTWVEIEAEEGGRPRLRLSHETADRLTRALSRLIATLPSI